MRVCLQEILIIGQTLFIGHYIFNRRQMLYSQDPNNLFNNNIKFSQLIKANKARHPSSSHPKNSKSGSASPNDHELREKIDGTAYVIRNKTIALVTILRQYSLPGNLEKQIQQYLTEVLDEMDRLQDIPLSERECSEVKEVSFEGASFLQVQKLVGDNEENYLEDTLRELNSNVEDVSRKNQAELHDKIEHILKSISEVSIEDEPSEVETQDKQKELSEKKETGGPLNEGKSKGAHRFSNLYIRDFQKGKKKLL